MKPKKPNRQWFRLLAVVLAFGLAAAACGSSDSDDASSDDAGSDDAGSDDAGTDDAATDAGFDGLEVSVSSKDFTEQIVLGEILVAALEDRGAVVDNQTNLGGTSVNRDALLAGEIDTYWEYNGTGWAVHLAQEDPSFDAEQLTSDVRDLDLTENDVRWLGRSPFNDTYGFATGPDLLDGGSAFTLESMAAYLEANPDASLCLETEFPNRPDGLVLFEDATGYEVPESQIEILETGIIYDEIASGNCDFGEVFTTDGRIPGLSLNLVADPGVFILYNVSLTMPDAVYQQAPAAWDDLVAAILAPLDEDTMSELNRRVSIDGEDAADVAVDYLTSNGLIG
jgi:osmoprotectant transport system substrate-binding protein